MTFDPDHLDTLLADWRTGADSAAQAAAKTELNQLAKSSPEAARYLAKQLQDEALIATELKSQAARELFRSPLGLLEDVQEKEQRLRNIWPAFWIGAAAVVVFAFTLSLVRFSDQSVETIVVNPAVGTVVEEFGGALEGPVQNGDLRSGRYQLERGLANLQLKQGVQLVVAGPAAFEIVDPMRVNLEFGKIRAQVSEEGKTFKIKTGEVLVTDLGTEFGVEAQKGETSEVHVFDGLVQVKDKNRKRNVRQGFAAEWGPEGMKELDGPVTSAFPTPRTLSFRRWERYRRELLADPDTLAFYDFNAEPRSGQDVLVNQAQPGTLDGLIHGARRVGGRWAQKGALLFERDGDRVEFAFPESHEEITLAAWMKIDRTESQVAAIFNSNGLAPGGLHWETHGSDTLTAMSPRNFQIEATEPNLLSQNEWQHVALTYRSGQAVRCYLNGQIQQETEAGSATPLALGASHLGFWADPTRYPEQRGFRGRLDEFLILKKELTPTEVQSLYQQSRPRGW